MAINPILINNRNKAYGGYVTKLAFSAEFGSANQMTVDFFSEDGEYSISESRLSSERGDKISIPFNGGYKHLRMLPVKYEKTKDPSSRILRVSYLDFSKVYLDKHIVLLYARHAYKAKNRVLLVGKPLDNTGKSFEPATITEETWEVGQQFETKYKFYDLILAMQQNGIQLSNKLKGYNVDKSLDLYRDYSGTLREVLNAWASDLNLIFYWDTFGVGAPEVGNLNFIDLSKVSNNLSQIKSKVAALEQACATASSSEYYTIENNFLNATIINCEEEGSDSGTSGGITKFYPFNMFFEKAESQNVVPKDIANYDKFFIGELRVFDEDGSAGQATQTEKDLTEILKAVSLGPEFYRYYVLIKLMVAWVQIEDKEYISPALEILADQNRSEDSTVINDVGEPDAKTIEFLKSGFFSEGNQAGDAVFVVKSIERNLTLEKLYHFNQGQKITRAMPIFIEPRDLGLDEIKNRIAKINNYWPKKYIYDIIENKEYRKIIENQLFTGFLIGAIKIDKYLAPLMNSPESDVVYKGMRMVLDYHDSLFYSSDLMTQKLMSLRKYEKNVDWEYAGTSKFDSRTLSQAAFYKIYDQTSENIELTLPDETEEDWTIRLSGEATNWRSSPYVWDYNRTGDYNVNGYKNQDNVTRLLSFNYASSFSEGGIEEERFSEAYNQSSGSITQRGYDDVQYKRSQDGKSMDKDYGIVTYKKEGVERIPEVKNYSVTIFTNESSGGEIDVSNSVFFMPFDSEKFITDLNSVTNLPRIGILKAPLFLKYSTSSNDGDSYIYGLANIPNLEDEKISEVKIIDESISQAQILDMLKEPVPSDDKINRRLIRDGVQRLSDAYQKLNVKDPGYGATIEISAFPQFSEIPSVEDGLESFSVNYSSNGINFTVNIGNSKRNQEKVENIFRLTTQENNMVRKVRMGSKVTKFTPEYKVVNRL